jgi:cytosine/adenosine deaminase-related metal-dependent hydrolase
MAAVIAFFTVGSLFQVSSGFSVGAFRSAAAGGLDGLLVVGKAVGEPALEHVTPVGAMAAIAEGSHEQRRVVHVQQEAGEVDGVPAGALTAATSRAAAACHLADRKGQLAPGFDADILAVQGNPLTDITALHHDRFAITDRYR